MRDLRPDLDLAMRFPWRVDYAAKPIHRAKNLFQPRAKLVL